MQNRNLKTVPKRKDKLRIGHLNIYHLVNKVPDLSVFLNTLLHFHIFGVSESRLKSSIRNNSISVPNFSVLRRDASSPQHTGLAVYIHNSILGNVKRRQDLESAQVESLWVEVKTS